MMAPPITDIVVAIESAVAGGSVAILRGDHRVDGIVGGTNQSRAEDLLSNIDELLTRNGIDKLSITSVVVSAGPGSFTGIRIGIATAMGLAAAFGIEVRQVSALAAIAMASGVAGPVLAALPVGRDTVCVQQFDISGENAFTETPPDAIAIDEFFQIASKSIDQTVVMNTSLYELLPADGRGLSIDAGSDLAQYIGRFHAVLAHLPEPIFIGKRK